MSKLGPIGQDLREWALLRKANIAPPDIDQRAGYLTTLLTNSLFWGSVAWFVVRAGRT